jgi:hypothetical protein
MFYLKKIVIGQQFMFVVSTAICLCASMFSNLDKVLFIGIIDIAISALIFTAFVVYFFKIKTSDISLAIYKKAFKIIVNISSLFLILMLLYFFEIKVEWYIILIGLCWRYLIFIFSLPYTLYIIESKL